MKYTIKAKEILMDQEYREIEFNFQNYPANVLILIIMRR